MKFVQGKPPCYQYFSFDKELVLTQKQKTRLKKRISLTSWPQSVAIFFVVVKKVSLWA
jgi:hypothetical protein